LGVTVVPALAQTVTVTSPVGPTTTGIVVFLPNPAVSPVPAPSPFSLAPRIIVAPNAGPLTPILPAGSTRQPVPVLPTTLLLTPTPATGSLVVPLRVPPIGTGPWLTQIHLVIPGPNPSQNTAVSLEQLLNMLIRSSQATAAPGAPAAPLVTVYTTSP